MNTKELVNEIFEVGNSDLWTSDDTYDYALDIVETAIKSFFPRSYIDYIDTDNVEFLNVVIGKINYKLSSTLKSCFEQWGDPWQCEGKEEAKFRKSLVAKTKRALVKVIKNGQIEATKVVKNNKEEIENIVKKEKQREKIHKTINNPIRKAIYKAQDKRRKNATVKIDLLYKALDYISLLEDGNKQNGSLV